MVTKQPTTQEYLQAFDFVNLFIEGLKWNYLREAPLFITSKEYTYTLRPIAEKLGVKVYLCSPDAQGLIPDDSTLRSIDREVTKYANQHIIIYTDAAQENQTWQWVRRKIGKPIAMRLQRFHKSQSGTLLAQQLRSLEIALEEELDLTHLDVAGRVEKAFDVERVTKRFYDRFQKEHAAFMGLIQGIEELNAQKPENRAWYTSVMLNRLMFIYFIQRHGFLDTKNDDALDGDPDYLRNRLSMVQKQNGTDKFHTFYRYFLLHLFHDGLSKREHSPAMEMLLGKIPYLNGGLFDIHTLERHNPAIEIPDEAFTRIFDFFDEFNWYLDDRPLRNDKEINPDVLGYIFEKYINQKQMGAYYTKEDITEYISKNTILPYLFEAAEQKCLIAFKPTGPVWSLLRDNPDRYIYDAVKKGVDLPLPPEIEAGIQDISRRTEWNKPAPEAYALPTEIWREVVARRKRYTEARTKLAAGEILSINDLITYNLDIRQFAQDAITYCEGIDLLHAFYETIEQITILDPTCGSGAFLFAALNILEPLYEACLDRMQIMVEERDRLDADVKPERLQRYPRIEYFRKVLNQVKTHAKRPYFIFKSIIINNLYGVDIMEEATEICRLRLFLKLVAQVEKFGDIEPLPDIDFNIRAGNTLVGFATQQEGRKAVESDMRTLLTSAGIWQRIEQKAKEIERAVADFRALQTEFDQEHENIAEQKLLLQTMLNALRNELDPYLASEYGIDHNRYPKEDEYIRKYEEWRHSHQPLHWFVEFYGIIDKGGFDVVIGNPPYVEYSKVRENYTVQAYQTELCGNLYSFMIERSFKLLQQEKHFGMIIPLSTFCTQRMMELWKFMNSQCSNHWVSHFGWRPSKLFEGVNLRLSIAIANVGNKSDKHVHTTKFNKWKAEAREVLFSNLNYVNAPQETLTTGVIPKLGYAVEEFIAKKLLSYSRTINNLASVKEEFPIYYKNTGVNHWITATYFPPKAFRNERLSQSSRQTIFATKDNRAKGFVGCCLNSNLFFWFYTVRTNCRDLNPSDIRGFPIPENIEDDLRFGDLAQKLMDHLDANSTYITRNQKQTGAINLQSFHPGHSKIIIDEIDSLLAKHYGFTDEERDFIINYDIKYRMGRGGDEADIEE
jgi:Eco57I restriction-modification methylase